MANTITSLVLSAGLSGRMNAFKPLLKLKNGKSFIKSVVEKLLQVSDEVVVVTGFKSKIIEDELKSINTTKNIRVKFNENYNSGMFTSLQAGLENSNSHWYLYHFVDQPSLPNIFYSDFVQQVDTKFNWVQPIHKHRRGHPILFDDNVKKLILDAESDATLRDISKNKSIKKKFWECDTELIFQDIDTIEDYNRSNY